MARPHPRRPFPHLGAERPVMSRQKTARVVHVIGMLDRGGAESVALDLCRRLPPTAPRQVFLTLGGGVGRLAPQFAETGAAVRRCPLKPVPTFVPRLWRQLRTLRPDVVVSHVSVVSGLVLGVAALAGVRVRIAHMHSDGDGRPDSLRRRAMRKMLRAMLRLAATDVVGVSAGSVTFAGPRPGDPRYRVLPNCVDFDRFGEVRVTATPRDGGPVFVHIGRAAPEKNRPFLLSIHAEARRIRPATRLVVVGPGGVGDLERADARVGQDPTVELAGETDHVENYLAGADVLLLPSHREGLPGVVLQALAAGIPVVVSDLPGLRDLARTLPGITLLPLEAGPRAWARAALDLAELTTEGRRELCDAVRSSPYTLDQYVERWMSLWTART